MDMIPKDNIMCIGCIVMTAGQSKRFIGGNKLLEKIQGRELIRYTLDKVKDVQSKLAKASAAIELMPLVVTCWDEIAKICEELSIDCLQYEGGLQSETIRRGLQYAKSWKWAGCMFMTGDQPLTGVNSLIRLMRAFEKDNSSVYRLCWGNKPGNPTIFPARYFTELMKLTGDQGGKSLLKTHEIPVTHVSVEHSWELLDVDTRQDLETVQRIIVDEDHSGWKK